MKSFEVPDWLRDLVKYIQRELKLENWSIDVKVVACAGGDPANMAIVRHSPNTWSATIYFRFDVENTFEWWQTTYHELVHLKVAFVHQLICKNIIPELPHEIQNLATGLWRDAHEQVVDSIATCFAEIYKNNLRKD